VSTGSEVCICIEAVKYMKDNHNLKARVVSMPCFEVFDTQSKEHRLKVIPDGIPSMSVEAMSTLGWERYSHEQFGLNRFGASGPYMDVYKVSHPLPVFPQVEKIPFFLDSRSEKGAKELTGKQKFEFTPEGITKRALATVDFYKGDKVRSPINRAFQQLI